MRRAAPILLFALLGCGEDEHDETAAGWKVTYADEGTLAGGYDTIEGIYAKFDAAMQRSLAEVPCPKAREIVYHIVDNARFPVGNVYATGMFEGKSITVAMYQQMSLPPGSEFPDEALPWTMRIGSVTQSVYFCTREPAQVWMPALAHELEHANGMRH